MRSAASASCIHPGHTFNKSGNRLSLESRGRCKPPRAGPGLLRDFDRGCDGLDRLISTTHTSLHGETYAQ